MEAPVSEDPTPAAKSGTPGMILGILGGAVVLAVVAVAFIPGMMSGDRDAPTPAGSPGAQARPVASAPAAPALTREDMQKLAAEYLATYSDRLTRVYVEYEAKSNALRDAGGLNVLEGDTREELRTRLGLIAEALAATDKLVSIQEGLAVDAREWIVGKGVPPEAAEGFASGIEQASREARALQLRILDIDARILRRGQEALGGLEQAWGTWSVNPDDQRLVVGDAAGRPAVDAYHGWQDDFAGLVAEQQAIAGQMQSLMESQRRAVQAPAP
jgi:hypothetical protein